MLKKKSVGKPAQGAGATKEIEQDNNLERLSVLAWMRAQGFVEWNANIGINVNEYPFVTFINAKNKAENVYFSIGAANALAGDEVVDAKFLNKYAIVQYINADGEERTKLARKGGNRISIDTLAELEEASM